MQSIDQYKMINLKDEIGLENVNGVLFWAFVRESEKSDFLETIKSYTDDLKARDKVRSWHLKEWTNMENHFFTSDNTWDRPSTNFWFCIDPSNQYTVGDWFMFLGAQDRVNAFTDGIKFDYETWWVPKSDEYKEKDYARR